MNVSELRLSDSYLGDTPENSLELIVKVIKMEYNKSSSKTNKVLERSEKLRDYSTPAIFGHTEGKAVF